MIEIKVNAERAGRVQKPAKSIEIIDPETGIELGRISFSKYGWRVGKDDVWAINIHPSSKLRLDIHLEKEHSPEIVAGGYGGKGGIWRFDPSQEPERKQQDLIKAVERITGTPVEVVKIETKLELDDPEWWERD